ncbi:hypothetical protein BKA66DRAFT_551506 [Pyrenochaeta sp. MPI-SDFR-AT-0127]|nr:hypothetical protein BKA66DRAFT_551506 [Pyrenochaeta sp. MPI-SDFR-AT-0127]
MSQLGSKRRFEQLTNAGLVGLRVDGRAKMDWREKLMLIIDEVSMLGTPVVMLKEQVRAAAAPQLQHLLKRIRQGICDQNDIDLLNTTCYREGKRIPWESGVTVVTPLNKNRDNSSVPVPAVFMFVVGMPVVVNQNTHLELKLVNGAIYTAVDVILERTYPGHPISDYIIIHFRPPAAVVLASESTKEFYFVGMRPVLS